MKRKSLILLAVWAVAAVLLLPLTANATMFSFIRITNNAPTDLASQFYMDVTENSDVLIKIGNSGPLASVISEIYFYDGAFLDGPATNITYSSNSGIVFAPPAIPENLPGYSGPPSTLSYSADADNPAPFNGVNPGEWVQFEFTLLSGVSFNDLITALSSGNMLAGLHVTGIGDYSDSFTSVPVPPSVLLLGFGLLGLGLIGWRRKKGLG